MYSIVNEAFYALYDSNYTPINMLFTFICKANISGHIYDNL